MRINWTRVVAIFRKELREYRHNRFIVLTMTLMPLLFIVLPSVQLLTIRAAVSSTRFDARIGISMLYMLLIPAIVPSALAAYAIVGERDQGTLEPILITPITSAEFLIGKALAALVPTLFIAYAIFGIFLGIAALFALPAVVSAIFQSGHLLVLFLFAPLLAGWSIWVGIAISARSSDMRIAQQLSTLASLPPLALAALMSFNIITPSLGLGLGLAALLLLLDGLGWRGVAVAFDRERLVTGSQG